MERFVGTSLTDRLIPNVRAAKSLRLAGEGYQDNEEDRNCGKISVGTFKGNE
jgi:hypothetical protein